MLTSFVALLSMCLSDLHWRHVCAKLGPLQSDSSTPLFRSHFTRTSHMNVTEMSLWEEYVCYAPYNTPVLSWPNEPAKSTRPSCLLCQRCLLFSWSKSSCNIMQITFWMTLHAHRHWGPHCSSPCNWIERQKLLTFKCKWCMSIRVVTLFSQIDPGGLTSLRLMETELLIPAVIWSVGSETTSPLLPTPSLVSFVLYNHSHSAYLNTCSLMKANREKGIAKWNIKNKDHQPPWQLQGM